MFTKRLQGAPKEILNWRLWYMVFAFGLMGASRGIDEGLTGTTASLPSFSRLFKLKDPSKTPEQQADELSNITSMVQMGSILGALVGFYLTDKLGRLWATRELCVVWIVGIAMYLGSAANGSLGLLYAGRFIAGIGIGQTVVVGPTYLAEIAPRYVRGLCVCFFSGSVYFGTMLAYFAAYGSSIHISGNTQLQWVVPTLLHIYVAVTIIILSFGCVESPRWLLKVGKPEKAAICLSKIRHLPIDHPFLQGELRDVMEEIEREKEATMGTTWFGPLRELVMIPANRYRLMLSVMTQLFSQWSGANSITIYAVEYFAMVGISGSQEKLFATAILGLVKFISATGCAFFLIDFIGRKRSLLFGATLQFIAMLYMAIFLTIDSAAGDKGAVQSGSDKHAATGAIVMIYLSGFGFALGWNSCQYLVNAEIYPLRLRAIGASFAMTFHFVNQYGNSKAVPSMFLSLGNNGTMFFFAAVIILGVAWALLFLPELSGMSLESVNAVFQLPWWQIGRRGRKFAEGLEEEKREERDEKEAVVTVERVGED
ncbi:hypothetical protein PRZ48_008591 [Zasmidium cellare]|uniref:Major facilitator superfamily (MFS) profile domain-containing protein n=1 Tax=Zasmidium cellare TaxID=395010 RepID=A0ABR0EFW4_ZASCE|nr:hypothetical protein PRZ48_008591 [Zasmidium cellare]